MRTLNILINKKKNTRIVTKFLKIFRKRFKNLPKSLRFFKILKTFKKLYEKGFVKSSMDRIILLFSVLYTTERDVSIIVILKI